MIPLIRIRLVSHEIYFSDCYLFFCIISFSMATILGYLLLRLEDDELFELVSKAMRWQLSAPDARRGAGAVRTRQALAAAAPVVSQTIVRIIAVCSAYRFPTFLDIALFLACDSAENCMYHRLLL